MPINFALMQQILADEPTLLAAMDAYNRYRATQTPFHNPSGVNTTPAPPPFKPPFIPKWLGGLFKISFNGTGMQRDAVNDFDYADRPTAEALASRHGGTVVTPDTVQAVYDSSGKEVDPLHLAFTNQALVTPANPQGTFTVNAGALAKYYENIPDEGKLKGADGAAKDAIDAAWKDKAGIPR